METGAPDTRVDDLRQRLRSLGYLDAGVDRFVLAPARGTRGPAAIAWLASLRIGVLAALLLGPAAAIGLGNRLPGLITGARDAIVIAGYMGVLFGAAVALAAFTVSLIGSWTARRAGAGLARFARPLALLAGAIVSILCLTYLTLWWQTANAGFGWAAPAWTAFALAVAVAISLLLGHAVTLTTLAVIVAGTGEARDVRGVPGASWRVSIAAGTLAFAGAAALLLLTAPAGAHDRSVPAGLTVVPSGLRIRLLAIDGVDPRLLAELSAEGRLPALSEAFAGARATLDESGRAGESGDLFGDPARAWTTIATGQPPSVHGVHELETRRVAGVQGTMRTADRSALARTLSGATDLLRLTRPAVASGSERREKTLWEVASDAGLRTAVVNWWATWPAPPDAGVVLSDRATLRLERGGTLDAEVAPAPLYDTLRERWPQIRERARSLAAAAFGSPPMTDEVRAVLLRSAELDAIQLVLAEEVAASAPDLLAVYLPGLDIAQHALLSSSEGGVLSPSDVAARVVALRHYYAALDRLLAPFVAPHGDDLVIVVTAPGRVTTDAGAQVTLRGAAARTGAAAQGRPTDVAPSVLYALGIPVSERMSGRPLLDLFAPAFTARYPVRLVPTYGQPAARMPARTGQPLDQEMIDRLRSLGYVR